MKKESLELGLNIYEARSKQRIAIQLLYILTQR